jgi:hypothetical protein
MDAIAAGFRLAHCNAAASRSAAIFQPYNTIRMFGTARLLQQDPIEFVGRTIPAMYA